MTFINAGGQFLEPVPGMAYFSSVDAFAMIRGGHVDVTILGAHQVSATGDLANWMLPDRGVGNIGGAMDLAAGAEKVIVAMEHNDRNGHPKVVQECSFPLTGKGCVSLVVTDVAVMEPTPDGMALREVAPGWSADGRAVGNGRQADHPGHRSRVRSIARPLRDTGNCASIFAEIIQCLRAFCPVFSPTKGDFSRCSTPSHS